MKRQLVVANSLLWAAAIIASALLKAPAMLTLILLPNLGLAFVLIGRGAATSPCAGTRPGASS
jgi:hypothetical protein